MAASGVRSLTLSNVASQLPGKVQPEDPLDPGEMQLFSFYKPALEADRYKILAEQQILDGTEKLGNVAKPGVNDGSSTSTSTSNDGPFHRILNQKSGDATKQPQYFEVVAPQFTLPANSIHSHYPPDGHQDESRVLPHVILEDPHLPWERWCGSQTRLSHTLTGNDAIDDNLETTKPPSGTPLRQQVPWLAVVCFDPLEELDLTIEELTNMHTKPPPLGLDLDKNCPLRLKLPRSLLPDAVVPPAVFTPPPTGAYSMTVEQYLNLFNTPDRPNYENNSNETGPIKAGTDAVSQDIMSVIFPRKSLVQQLFGSKGENIEQHKHLAHVRRINTKGMPDTDPADQDLGLFSVIVSHRTGPSDIKIAHPQVAHLVSIEHLDGALSEDISSPTGPFYEGKAFQAAIDANPDSRFAMVSLYSWIYTALPPNPVNFIDTMIDLGKGLQTLRPKLQDDFVKAGTFANPKTPLKTTLLDQRLREGYMFVRWRTQTGEPTAAMHRGPLCPGTVTWPPSQSDWPIQSNYGSDYQILDTKLGLMDISYSLAWNLGKMLAIADRNFSGALMRFRSIVHEQARDLLNKAQANISTNTFDHAQAAASAAKMLVTALHGNQVAPVRFATKTAKPAPLPSHAESRPLFQTHVEAITRKLTSGKMTTSDGKIDVKPYNEFNSAASSDWATIARWISDKLFLGGVPAHNLFVDPSHLPMESLRVFYIDPNWLDCLIDGALSTANHLERDDDFTRQMIKTYYNDYLKTDIIYGKHPPQVPKYGFVIRSQVIKAFPDLRVQVTFKDAAKADNTFAPDPFGRADICRQTNIDPTTLLVLLDRGPEDISYIRLSQPPHQQRFSLGDALDGNTLEFEFKKIYTEFPGQFDKNGLPKDPLRDHLILQTNEKEAGWNSFPRKSYLKIPAPSQKEPKVYDWDSRVVNVENLANHVQSLLNSHPPWQEDDQNSIPDLPLYSDDVITSVPMALQLNDPVYFLNIPSHAPAPAGSDPSHPTLPDPRQLWGGLTTSDLTPPTISAQQNLSQKMVRNHNKVKSATNVKAQLPPPLPAIKQTNVSKPIKPIVSPPAPARVSQPIVSAEGPRSQITPIAPGVKLTKKPVFVQKQIAAVSAQAVTSPKLSHYRITVRPSFATIMPNKKNPAFTLPTQYPYLMDLNFTVRRVDILPAPGLTEKLHNITIDIPMAPIPPGSKDPDLLDVEPLIETYEGPGARMLSNPRFNCQLSLTNGFLHATLVPRGDQFLPLNSHKTDELDFVIGECYISDIKTLINQTARDPKTNQDRRPEVQVGRCFVTYTEYYEDDSGLPGPVGSTPGVKRVPGQESPWIVYKENRNVDLSNTSRGEDLSGLDVDLTS